MNKTNPIYGAYMVLLGKARMSFDIVYFEVFERNNTLLYSKQSEVLQQVWKAYCRKRKI